MVRGVAGREDGSGVSAIEFFLESEGGAFTLDTKEGRRERGRRGGTREKGKDERRKTKSEDHSKGSSHKTEVYIAYLKALAVLELQ